MQPRATEQSYRARVARVVAAIVADPMAEHRLEDLAARAHFSPFHFHRVYGSIVGETVAATIRRVRLARAAGLLAEGRESVTQVGLAVGYDSPQAFSRAFGVFAGQSPRAFQQHLNSPLGDAADANDGFSASVVDRPALRVQALRHDGPLATIPHTHWRMQRLIGDAPFSDWLGLSIGEPSEPGGYVYHVAVVTPEPLPAELGLQAMTVPAGLHALHEHVGPYTRISAALDMLFARWFPASGYEPDERLAIERYVDAPAGTPQSELRTELLIPIRAST